MSLLLFFASSFGAVGWSVVCDCGISWAYSLASWRFLPNMDVTLDLDDVTWTIYANFCVLMPRTMYEI